MGNIEDIKSLAIFLLIIIIIAVTANIYTTGGKPKKDDEK